MRTPEARRAPNPSRRPDGRPSRRPPWTAIRAQAGEFSARTVGSFLGEIASRETVRQLDRGVREQDRKIDRILSLSAELARNSGIGAAGAGRRTCRVRGCRRPHHARGRCALHYRRMMRSAPS